MTAGPVYLTEPEPKRGEAVEVAPGIRRIVAANPGPMTYHGTNTYLIEQADGVCVLDPGPDDAAHVAATLRAAGGKVTAILLSHTHADHLGALAALAQATGAPVLGWHRPAVAHVRPDRPLHDHDEAFGFQAIHTPGHAPDHVCFAWRDRASTPVLFSADHVMTWSSSIVSPPEGDMADYVASLHRVLARDDALYLPGHGPPMPAPRPYVQALLAHRIAREDAVLSVLTGQPGADVPAVTAVVYAGAPAAVRPMAERNVLAHLLKLEREGRARREGAAWRAG